jgi:hypothetical protein
VFSATSWPRRHVAIRPVLFFGGARFEVSQAELTNALIR